MIDDTRFFGRNPLGWLLCFVVLGLAACAQVSEEGVKQPERKLVYPDPPDEPRFAYQRTIHSSNDVELDTADDIRKRLLLGDAPRAGTGMRKPYGVGVHHGRIFVSDTANRVVTVFDIPEARVFSIGNNPELQLSERIAKPIGISVDGSGDLYVADASAKYILVYNRDGKFLRKFGGPDYFDRLASIKVDKKGERAYVVDIGGVSSENHRVRVFDAKTGKHLFDFGKRGTGPGEFNLPRSVAIGKDKLYVVDGGNFRIQVFDMEGKFLQTFGQVGKQLGSFGRPKEADTDAEGNLYVIDAAFANFQIFNPQGELLMFIGERGEQDKPGAFNLPSGISVDEDGRIYVTDQLFKSVTVFRPYKLDENSGYLSNSTAAKAKK